MLPLSETGTAFRDRPLKNVLKSRGGHSSLFHHRVLCLNSSRCNGHGKPNSSTGVGRKYGKETVVVVLGGAEAEASGLAAETVTSGDPTFAGPLTGVQLGLPVYHIFELKEIIPEDVWDEQVSMMEMVLEVDDIIKEVATYRQTD